MVMEAILLLYVIALDEGVQCILLRDTGQRPELSLVARHEYHMFLSHNWSFAQDAAATIKRQLQLVLPGVRAFLVWRLESSRTAVQCFYVFCPLSLGFDRRWQDVDDLKDVEELEEYVKGSNVILLLMTRGYLFSRSCLREVAATLKNKKPYIFDHEVDASKGGAPLQVLQRELKDVDLLDELFDRRPPRDRVASRPRAPVGISPPGRQRNAAAQSTVLRQV
eukprot:4580401-Prymnesium_polylepis.1